MREIAGVPFVTRVMAVIVLAAAGSFALAAPPRTNYSVEPLVSDSSGNGETTDLNLRNGWGLTSTTTSPWWVASNVQQVSTVYDGQGITQGLVVEIPGSPTGIVANAGAGFLVTDGTNSGPARFLFATLEGTVAGWNPSVPPGTGPSTEAFTVLDESDEGAVYTGLAIATTPAGDRIYTADFANGRIEAYDATFAEVELPEGAFTDPKLPAGYAPFNVQALAGRIFVAYAKVDPVSHEEATGNGLGIIAMFDTDGRFIKRVAAHGQLNAPWGMAIAPNNFGEFSGDLLVGNFGDGRIVAFEISGDMQSFRPDGLLRDERNKPIAIDGLWGIAFGNGGNSGPANALYFAAGPNDETGGLFGRIVMPQ
jgi:uncharacterized protein (TIGR03118 family)